MAGGEYGAAVLIGEDGGVVGVDFDGDVHDLGLVQADEGTEHGHLHHGVGAGDGLHGLGRHLAQALAGDQGQRAEVPGQPLGDAHHEAAGDEGAQLLRALLVDLQLTFGEGDHVDPHAVGVIGKLLRQLHDLVLGQLAGVGRGLEVDGAELDAALHQLVARHGGVDAAGQEQRALAAGAHGHAAHGLDLLNADVGHVPDLHHQTVLGRMDVHLQVGVGLQHPPADLHGDLHRVHGEFLVRALALDLEGAGIGLHHLHAGGGDLLEVLVQLHGGADGVHAEHLGHPVDAGVQVVKVGHVNAGIRHTHVPAQGLDGLLDVVVQYLQKVRAVRALEKHLAVADEQYMPHGFLSPLEPLEQVVAHAELARGVVEFFIGGVGGQAEPHGPLRVLRGNAHGGEHRGHLQLL